MPTAHEVAFADLPTSDLIVDAIYKGGAATNVGADALARLLPVGNSGGFRYRMRGGVGGIANCALIALFSTEDEPNWPDHLDVETGHFTYYGDNRRPGHQLDDTPRGGNRLLQQIFAELHGSPANRPALPPIFIFTGTGVGRDVRFRGLAAPGAPGLQSTDDLMAIWKTAKGSRFQNYRATFTVLDVATVTRAWITDTLAGQPLSANAPTPWLEFVNGGIYRPLTAPRAIAHRTPSQQKPSNATGVQIISVIHKHFDQRPFDFERCAVELARMLDPNVVDCDLTRPWRDGGRDAVGFYRIGPPSDPIRVEFALEAKCYTLKNGNGVKQTSRLISRLRHRQFGIFVTTSFINEQAYQEIREDGHPVIILSSGDIVQLLASKGYATVPTVQQWLATTFP